jgi:PcfJ-like protein
LEAVALMRRTRVGEKWMHMHHCVALYFEAALKGVLCICSIRQNGERVATVAFSNRGMEGPAIEQMRGPSNKLVPEIEKAISRWLWTQRKQNENEAEIKGNEIPPADAAE